jgi:PEP-CTERM motif
MKTKIMSVLSVCIALSATAATASMAGITIDVYPSLAPNSYGSPSWGGYMANALNALENGLTTVGDPSTDPTAYGQAPSIVQAGDNAVTTFNSWRGVVNPVAPFNHELGTRIHFGLHAYGNGGTQFALNDLTFDLNSSDPGDTMAFSGDFVGYSYNGTSRIGIDYGPDRIKGTADDVRYTSGNGTTLVDEIDYIGVGNAWWPGGDDPNPGNPAGGAQAAMDTYSAWVSANQPLTLSCSYSIGAFTGSNSVLVAPEPGTLALLAMGALSLLACAWRRRQS